MMVLLGGLLLFTTACGQRVVMFDGIKEKDANEMMAVLLREGISCDKAASKEDTWSLTIDKASFPRAEEILRAKGYPQTHFEGLGEVFGKKGMVSSPMEEQVRFMYALSQSLAETISLIDGVIDARVHVVLENNDPFSEKTKPSSASVFVKCAYDANIDAYIPQIKNLVVNSIEGLTYDKVSVVAFRAAPPDREYGEGNYPQGEAQETQKGGHKSHFGVIITAIVLLVLLAGIGGGAFYFLQMRKNAANQEAEKKPEGAPENGK